MYYLNTGYPPSHHHHDFIETGLRLRVYYGFVQKVAALKIFN